VKKVKVFVSHSSADSNRLKSLEKLLSEHGLKPVVVIKTRSLKTYFADKVKKAIKSSDYVIPIITEVSMKSQWVNQEIGFAEACDLPIYPIIESRIKDELKGFINREQDHVLFRSCSSKYKTSWEFRKGCLELINYILKESGSDAKSRLSSSTSLKSLEGKNISLAKPPFNASIDSKFLSHNVGFFSIWAYVSEIHNRILSKRRFMYIVGHASNNGRQSDNELIARYPNAWAIERITPISTDKRGVWRFWCNNIDKKTTHLDYSGTINFGWHLFSVSWSIIENYIKFIIDGEVVSESEFRNWPKEYSSLTLGTWPTRTADHFFDSKIGPWEFTPASFSNKLVNDLLRKEPN
jgi:hypothetical protein